MGESVVVKSSGKKRRIRISSFFSYKMSNAKYELLGVLILILSWSLGGWLFVQMPDNEHFVDFLPIPALKALARTVLEERFWLSVWASIRRIAVGISFSATIGIPVGLITGYYPRLRHITYAPTQFLRMVSPLAWMPVALIVFAGFESAIYFLIAMATVWPIILNTASGVAAIDSKLMEMAKNQGADHVDVIRTIVIPASMPAILSSLRLALGVAWIVLVPAEFLGVASGLGYLINDARDTLEYDMLMAMIVAIGILGFALDKLLHAIQSKVVKSLME